MGTRAVLDGPIRGQAPISLDATLDPRGPKGK